MHVPADGYVDDVFVCVKDFKKLQERYGIEKLQTNSKCRLRSRTTAENRRDKNARADEKAEHTWDCDEELDEVLDYSDKKSLDILKKQNLVKQVLEYSGIE